MGASSNLGPSNRLSVPTTLHCFKDVAGVCKQDSIVHIGGLRCCPRGNELAAAGIWVLKWLVWMNQLVSVMFAEQLRLVN